jgi:hypothetical protein
VVAAPPPQEIDADGLGWSDRFKVAGLAHAPGALAWAARIALGWTEDGAEPVGAGPERA